MVMLLLLAAMTAALLHAAWRKPYFKFDDEHHVGLALSKPAQSWFAPSHESTYFPVTVFSYWVDHRLFGWFAPRPVAAPEVAGGLAGRPQERPLSSAPAMRLMNGLYHLLAGWMLWLLLRRLGAGAGLAAFVALVWTGHPLACESVCWVSERKNVLCALFGFGALLAWTAERRCLWRMPLVCLLYALSGLSKPMALGLLPVFVVLEVLATIRPLPGAKEGLHEQSQRAVSGPEQRRWLSFGLGVAPLLVISSGVLAAGVYAHSLELIDPPGGTVFTALLTDAEIFARYAANIVCPLSLSFFYGVEPIVSLGDARLWCYGLGLLAVCGGLIWAAGPERRALAWLGVFWFFGALGPNANLVAIPFWMQDRYVYLSTAGLLLAVGAAVVGMVQRLRQERILPALGVAAVAVTALLGAWRGRTFADYEALSLEAVARQPSSAMAQICAAHVLRNRYYQHARKGEELPHGSPQWRQEVETAQRYALSALQHYDAAEHCTGVKVFVNSFTLHTWEAELLAALGKYEEARAILGPLPPPGLAMLSDMEDSGQQALLNRKDTFAGYPPRTLAGAWLIRGEASLRRCATPGITAEQKQALAEQARQEAEESMKCHKMDHEAYVLWARAQMLLADLYAARKDMPAALKLYNQAVAKLQEVPAASLSAFSAKRLLDNVPPPQPGPE